MKIKRTKKDNIKLTLSNYELEILIQLLSHVELNGDNKSNVIADILNNCNPLIYPDYDKEISVKTEIEYGQTSHYIKLL